MRIGRIFAIVMVAVMLVGCGGVESKPKTSEKKEDKIETVVENATESEGEDENTEETTEDVATEEAGEVTPDESVVNTVTKKTETKSTQQKTETKKTTEPVAPVVTTPVVTVPETKDSECQHQWGKEKVYYDIFQKMTFGCNGCGLALFEWAEDRSSVEHIENLYFHEPCPTDRFPEPCSGGGYHSENVIIGQCLECSTSTNDPEGRVAYRQCMWTEMGKRCSQNTVLGEYEKTEFNQNHFMYYETCKCGNNVICRDGVTGRGIIYGTKEVCIFCGINKK